MTLKNLIKFNHNKILRLITLAKFSNTLKSFQQRAYILISWANNLRAWELPSIKLLNLESESTCLTKRYVQQTYKYQRNSIFVPSDSCESLCRRFRNQSGFGSWWERNGRFNVAENFKEGFMFFLSFILRRKRIIVPRFNRMFETWLRKKVLFGSD